MKSVVCVCFGVLVSLSAAAAEPIRVKLDFVRIENPTIQEEAHHGRKPLPLEKVPKTGIAAPDGVEGAVLFGAFPLAGKKGPYSFAIIQNPSSGWYETLYVDANENGAFDAEERYTTKAVEKPVVFLHPEFGNATPMISTFLLETPFQRAAGAAADGVYELDIRTYKERLDSLGAYFTPVCHRQGKITLEGQNYNICLLDMTWNRKFNDFAKEEGQAWKTGDEILFWPESQGDSLVEHDEESLADLRVLGNEIYKVAVSEDGSELTMTPCDMARGRLVMEPAVASLEVGNDDGRYRIGPGKFTVLPVGVYTIYTIRYEQVMPDNSVWRLFGYQAQKALTVDIKPNKTTKLPLGPPFTMRVTYVAPIRDLNGSGQAESADEPVPMAVELLGQCGESYSYDHYGPDSERIPTADVIITTRGGKELTRVKRSTQKSIDVIPPDYLWGGPIPEKGVVAACDLGLPWKTILKKTVLKAAFTENANRSNNHP